MTTIAFRDEIMAADSRCVEEGIGITTGQKLYFVPTRRPNRRAAVHLVAGAGWHPSILLFLDWYKSQDKELATRLHACVGDKSFEAMVWTGKRLFSCDESLMLDEVTENYYALGSGAAHAITALDCGKSAVEAVRLAARRDVNTGGRIVSLTLKR